ADRREALAARPRPHGAHDAALRGAGVRGRREARRHRAPQPGPVAGPGRDVVSGHPRRRPGRTRAGGDPRRAADAGRDGGAAELFGRARAAAGVLSMVRHDAPAVPQAHPAPPAITSDTAIAPPGEAAYG